MKFKLITAAVILAASNSASAAPVSPLPQNSGGGGLSEAIFSVWDPTTNQSYSQDLGTTWQTFRDNLNNASFSASYTVNTDVYNAAVGASDTVNLIWNVSVANGQNVDFSNFDTFGVIGTSNVGNNINQAALNQAVAKHDQMATAQRGSMSNDGFGSDTPADVNSDPAINDAYFGTIANGGYAGDPGLWGTSWGTNGSTNNSAAFGTDLDFYFWKTGGFSPDPTVTKAIGSWSFDGTSLSYGATTASPVPVPAAVWLFGSGLMGLVGVSRRKKTQV